MFGQTECSPTAVMNHTDDTAADKAGTIGTAMPCTEVKIAVVGLPDDKWGETVGAFIRPAADQSVNKQELFAYLREHLAPHKTPKQWFQVEQFPLTGSGKIQKFVLRDRWVNSEVSEL